MVSKLIGIATVASLSAIAIAAALAAYRPNASPLQRVPDGAPQAAKASSQQKAAERRGRPGDPERGEEGHDRDGD